jgi:hypothetical protein
MDLTANIYSICIGDFVLTLGMLRDLLSFLPSAVYLPVCDTSRE